MTQVLNKFGATLGLAAFVLFGGCKDANLNLSTTSQLVDTEAPLYDHALEYLESHHIFQNVTSQLDCRENSEECILRVEANDEKIEGAAQSLIFYVATAFQALPGTVDLAGVFQYELEPVSYATVEEVGTEDLFRRYSYSCTFREGYIQLDQKPTVGDELTGQLELEVDCIEATVPDDTVPALLQGTFSSVVEDVLYSFAF